MLKAVLFDLGNTPVKYYERHEFDAILKQGIENVKDYLYCEGFEIPCEEELWENVNNENYESTDYSVRSLEERLIKIFNLNRSACYDRPAAFRRGRGLGFKPQDFIRPPEAA